MSQVLVLASLVLVLVLVLVGLVLVLACPILVNVTEFCTTRIWRWCWLLDSSVMCINIGKGTCSLSHHLRLLVTIIQIQGFLTVNA